MRDERRRGDGETKARTVNGDKIIVPVSSDLRASPSTPSSPSSFILHPSSFLQRHPHSTLPLSIIDPILLNQIVALAKFYIGASSICSRVG